MLLLRFFSAAQLWPSLRCCILSTAAFLLLSFNPLPFRVALAPFILFIVLFSAVDKRRSSFRLSTADATAFGTNDDHQASQRLVSFASDR